MMVAVDYRRGFEARLGDASPMARYAAFVRDTDQRQRQLPQQLRAGAARTDADCQRRAKKMTYKSGHP